VPPGIEGEASRLIGTWVYAGSSEYHISRADSGQIYFHERHFDREANVVVRTVSGRLRARGRWFYADLVDDSGAAQGEVRVRNIGDVNDEDNPGMYVLTQRAALGPSVNLADQAEIIAELDVGAVVRVVEVVHHEEQKRVRARVESPAGWISLVETVGGYRWAEKQGTAVSNFRLTMEDKWSADTVAHKQIDVEVLKDAAASSPPGASRDAADAAFSLGQTPPRPSPSRKMASRSPPLPPLSISKSEISPLPKVAEKDDPEELTPPPVQVEVKAEESAAPALDAEQGPGTMPLSPVPAESPSPNPPPVEEGPPPPPPSAPPPPWVVAMAGRRREPKERDAPKAAAAAPAVGGCSRPMDSPARSPLTKADSPSIFLVIEEGPLDFGLDLGGPDLGLPAAKPQPAMPQTPPKKAQMPPKLAPVASTGSPQRRSGPPGTPRHRPDSGRARRSIRSRFFSAGGS